MLVGPKSTAGSIASWANYGLAPADVVLTEAQSLIYGSLRCREMLSDALPLVLPIANSSLALPTGFLDPLILVDDQNVRMRYLRADNLLSRRVVDMTSNGGAPPYSLATGQPRAYAIFGEKLQFELAADVSYNLSLIAYVTPTALSAANPTNFLTTRYPVLLRTACLAIAADFRQDDATYQRNVQRLNNLIGDVKQRDELYLRGVFETPDYLCYD